MTHPCKTIFISLIFLFMLSVAAFAQETSDEYKKTIEMADSYFTKGDYINAKASYQIAIRLAPNEQYPKDRLQQSLDMIKVQMYQNGQYTQKIQVADDYYNKKDFDDALKYYQEALTILPGDVYASGKVQEISHNKADSQQLEANYQKSITNADKFFKDGKLDQALSEYKNASGLKPSESYPKEKALVIDSLITAKKEISDEFQSAMRDADLAVSRNKYDEAIQLLQKAINLMPNEPLPKQKLAETQNLKASWDSYNSIITAADDLYMNKDFQQAKDKYLQAKAIKPSDEYPQRMLEKIDIALMSVEESNRSSYEFSIQKADELFNQQDYEKAMVEYQKALVFKPDADYAKQRINDINNALNVRKSQEEAYSQSIARADKLYQDEKYEEARDEYNNAIKIKPLEQYPKVKVDELNLKIADLATKRERYNDLVKGADKLFFSDDYAEAREQYREASYLFPKEQYPLDQITMINEILGVRDKYVKAVTKADQLLYKKDLDSALLVYRNAANLSPKETYPVDKIKEIEAIQARCIELTSSADKAMQAKDYQKALDSYKAALAIKPNDIQLQGKIEEANKALADFASQQSADKQYQDAISAADKDLAAKDYQKALTGYQSAASLKPQEAYPKGKIDEINKTLGEIADQKAAEEEAARLAAEKAAAQKAAEAEAARVEAEKIAAAKSAEAEAARVEAEKVAAAKAAEEAAAKAAEEALNKQYQDAISAADKDLAAKDYQKALTGYQSAASLKPQEAYPKGKIDEINKTLGEIAAQKAAEEEAARLAAEKAAAQKAAEAEAARVEAEKIAAAKAAEAEAARVEAEKAAAAKAAEVEAARIEAEKVAAAKAAEEAAAKAAEEALNKQYQDAISAADNDLAAKDYQKALTGYQSAASLKPQEAYPKGKIEEINKTLGEIAAQKAAEEEAARLAAEKAAAQKAAEAEAARVEAEKAAAAKAAEAEAARVEAEKVAAAKAAEEATVKAAEEALNKQYQEAISAADKNLATKDYQKALTGYQSAASLKPQEAYPKGKIEEINKTLGEIAAQKAAEEEAARFAAEKAAAQKAAEAEAARLAAEKAAAAKTAEEALNKQYDQVITSANNYYSAGKYEEARTAYQEAGTLKPNEEMPKKQIIEIDHKIQAMQAERDQAYQVVITKADGFLATQDYEMAKLQYSRALELKPGESYPQQKLDEVNLQISKKRQLVQEEYDRTIIDADKFYQAKTYDNALDSYRAASLLKPDEAYPKEMANRILKLLSERSIVQINNDALLVTNNTTHKFEFKPVPVKDRKSNYIFFKARNASQHEYKLIISYGKDQTKNGGVVIKVPAGEELYEYIIRISAQYKWFSEDNNWISFYPEGGDIEVYLMQVSYSD